MSGIGGKKLIGSGAKFNFRAKYWSFAMNQRTGNQNDLVFSYLELRKAVGIIGVALPLVLAIGKLILQGPGLEPTISSYYYTDLGNWFVGSLCAIGVFLLSNKGYPDAGADRGPGYDQIAGWLACIFAVGVALFPMAPAAPPKPTQQQVDIGWAHWTLAALLFLTLAYFSLFLFTKTDPNRTPTPRKLKRNIVYRVCGYTILASILLIPAVTHTPIADKVQACHPVFWLESLAVEAFGIAWLTKGETILKDEPA